VKETYPTISEQSKVNMNTYGPSTVDVHHHENLLAEEGFFKYDSAWRG
jgi:hypothetical protein